jgi:hypothetical protein
MTFCTRLEPQDSLSPLSLLFLFAKTLLRLWMKEDCDDGIVVRSSPLHERGIETIFPGDREVTPIGEARLY